MQPNLSLDPMASLWSNESTSSSNNYFSPPLSGSGTDQSSASVQKSESNFGGNGNYFSGSNPNLTASTTQGGTNSTEQAGNTFMGANSPGQGATGSWKWMAFENNK